jgi:hypothetical protein
MSQAEFMRQLDKLSQLTEMSIGPLWLMRRPAPVISVAVADADASVSVDDSASSPAQAHIVLPPEPQVQIGDVPKHGDDPMHCHVCRQSWLEGEVNDSDVLVVVAQALTDEREQQLVERSLRAAGWHQPQALMTLHAGCVGGERAAIAALQSQLRRQQPQVMLVLGSAAGKLLGLDVNIVGKQQHYGTTPMVVTYHPADLISTPKLKAALWVDLCLAQHGS